MARTHHRINVEAQLIRQLFDEAQALEALGDELSLARAQAVRAEAEAALAKSGIENVEAVYDETSQTVPFTTAEEEAADKDAVAAAAEQAAATEAAAEREQLVEKLAAGTASGAEVQQALSSLLGG